MFAACATTTPLGSADFEQWASIPDPATLSPLSAVAPGALPDQTPDSAIWGVGSPLPTGPSCVISLTGPDTDPVLIKTNTPCSVTWA